MRVRRGPLIALAFWAIAFMVADVAAGRLRWRMLEGAGASARRLEQEYRAPNAFYHHDLKPNYTTDSAMWGPIVYPVRTNSLGFRDSVVRTVPLKKTRPRILFIGDSFTEGLGVPFDSTFIAMLARRYAPEGIEVLNAAVLSYSPAIYWKKIEYLVAQQGLEVDAVVVFIDISDIQDEALRYRVDSAGRVVDAPDLKPGFFARWVHNSIVLRSAAKAMRLARPHAPYGGCFAADVLQDVDCRAGWTKSGVVMRRYGRVGLELADQHMSALAAFLRGRQIPLTVVVYPWPQQLRWKDRGSRHERHWQEWSKREVGGSGGQFISLFDAFFAQVDRKGLDRTIDDAFIPGDVHWNAAGHRLVAETFAERFIPPAR